MSERERESREFQNLENKNCVLEIQIFFVVKQIVLEIEKRDQEIVVDFRREKKKRDLRARGNRV